jgi:CRP-like cAMP-binding protein
VKTKSGNLLLAGLSDRERRILERRSTCVDLERGTWLAESGTLMSHVYFPISGVYSALGSTENGQVEIGTVGNEGMVGIPAFLDDGIGLTEVLVQISGQALRLEKDDFQSLAMSMPGLRTVLNHYTQAFLSLAVQSAACNAMHTAEQRCARWLLMMHDRVGTDRFPLSQEMLARMLGVRRPTVSLATAGLKADGAVQFKRGYVTISSRRTLRAYACDCYATVAAEYKRLLGPHDAPPGGTDQPTTSAA